MKYINNISTVATHSIVQVLTLGVFAGFFWWTCTFISEIVLAFAQNRDSKTAPTTAKLLRLYLSGGTITALLCAFTIFLFIEVLGLPIEYFNGSSYLRISQISVLYWVFSTLLNVLFPNIFSQPIEKGLLEAEDGEEKEIGE